MGTLTVITGPMFAGKTTELIRVIQRYRVLNKRAVIFNHASDTRYAAAGGAIATHVGLTWAARSVYALGEIAPAELVGVDLVVIDEAQFFPDLVATVRRWLAEWPHIDIVASGLNGDAEQRPFGQVLDLIPLAEDVIHLTALCLRCNDGTPAHFSVRKPAPRTEESAAHARGIVHIGGADEYMAVCRAHLSPYSA